MKYRPSRCNTAADALFLLPAADKPEPESEDVEYDGCVAICNTLRTGTALGPDLVAAGAECCKVSQLCVPEAGETKCEAAQDNTPTLPGYSKAELQSFQALDPTLSVLTELWNRQWKLSPQEK